MLSLATLSATSDYKTGMWDNIILSTESVSVSLQLYIIAAHVMQVDIICTGVCHSLFQFIKTVFTVTGKDVQVFVDQWVSQSGCACFTGNFIFNRKRNVVELELKQDSSGKGVLRYVVSL